MNYLFLGSSVTYGSAANGVSFVEMLAEEPDTFCTKLAVSGTTLVDNGESSYVSRLAAFTPDRKYDRLIVQLSTNDATGMKPLGTLTDARDGFDVSTVCGAIEFIIAYATKHLGCPVSFYTGTKYASERYGEMVALLARIAEKWGITVLDLWNDPEMNAVSEEDYARFMADPIHPNITGYRVWWLPKFKTFLS